MPDMDEIRGLFKDMVLTPPKKKKEPKNPLQEEVRAAVRTVKKEAAKKKTNFQNGAGYDYVKVWSDDGTDYKYVPRARVVLEAKLGRKLGDHERAFFINTNLKGDLKYHPDNLIQGYKGGVPLDLLTCGQCGCRGNWTISEREEEK